MEALYGLNRLLLGLGLRKVVAAVFDKSARLEGISIGN